VKVTIELIWEKESIGIRDAWTLSQKGSARCWARITMLLDQYEWEVYIDPRLFDDDNMTMTGSTRALSKSKQAVVGLMKKVGMIE